MKTITVNIAQDGITADDSCLGNSGEHNSAELRIVLGDEEFLSCDFFRLWFGSRYSERLFANEGVITYSVPQQIMTPPAVKLQLCGYVITESQPALIIKSDIIKFEVKRSACCDMVCDTAETPFEVLSIECANSARAAMNSADEAEMSMANAAAYSKYSEFCSEEAEKSAELSKLRSDNIIEAINEASGENISTKILEQNSAGEIKLWIGTKQEFEETEPKNNTLYLFTDEISEDSLNEVLEISKAKPTMDEVVDKIYPVGSIYMSMSPTSPETLFGGGWQALGDRFLVGASETLVAGSVGGSGSHSHTLDSAWANICLSRTGSKILAEYIEVGEQLNYNRVSEGITVTESAESNNYPTSLGGSTDEKESLPPYLAVYMWQRIS